MGWFSRTPPSEFVEEPLADMAGAAEVLDDARRIAVFGLRSGKLQDDKLFALITQVEQALAATPPGEQPRVELLAPLVAEMPRAQRDIAPMTLKELRKFDPFGTRRVRRTEVWNARVRAGLATVAMIVLAILGCLIVWQNRASTVISEYAQDHGTRFEAAMIDLVVMTERFKDLGGGATVSALELSAVGQKMNEATAALARINANAVLAERLNASFAFLGLGRGSALQVDIAARPYQEPQDDSLVASAVSVLASSISTSPGTPTVSPADAAKSLCIEEGIGPDEWNALLTTVAQGDGSSARAFAASVNLYYAVRQMIDCVTGVQQLKGRLSEQQRDWATEDLEGKLATKLMITASILIPALMGVLGSLIYHFRVYMDPLRPDIPLQRIALRVFLGGFAGMATFLLLSQNSQLSPDPAATGFGGLAIPFLLGFSIDVFFRLLDKLVQQMNRWVDGIGGTQGGAPGSEA